MDVPDVPSLRLLRRSVYTNSVPTTAVGQSGNGNEEAREKEGSTHKKIADRRARTRSTRGSWIFNISCLLSLFVALCSALDS
jgi:hypothetical protein